MRIIVAVLVSAALAAAQNLKYDTLIPAVIEQRLQQATRENAERFERLKKLFQETGCDITEQPVSKKRLPNLICVLKGETGRTILVGAHFDATSKGVADNWSGAALLPSLFQSLKESPRKHTFVFLGFTDEELGLIGSQYYARHMTREEKERTDAMINMDTLGLGDPTVWVSRSDKTLTNWFEAASNYSKVKILGVNIEAVGSTDSESFQPTKIPRITISSVTQDTLKILHSPADDFSAMRMDHYYNAYKVIALYLALLDVKLGIQ